MLLFKELDKIVLLYNNVMKTFKELVYEITSKIPKGKVATYKQVARLAGNPKASRAVGLFMKINPNAPQVPCHRVVGSDGKLTGYSGGGTSVKKKMLIKEGVNFKNSSIDLSSSMWENLN